MSTRPSCTSGPAYEIPAICRFILWLGTRREAAAPLAYLVIFGNIGWAAGSLLAAMDLPGITGLGSMLVAGQGLAVLLLAVLEWIGVRHSSSLAAA